MLWRPLLFSLGPSARGKIVAVSRAPRGNSFNHLLSWAVNICILTPVQVWNIARFCTSAGPEFRQGYLAKKKKYLQNSFKINISSIVSYQIAQIEFENSKGGVAQIEFEKFKGSSLRACAFEGAYPHKKTPVSTVIVPPFRKLWLTWGISCQAQDLNR